MVEDNTPFNLLQNWKQKKYRKTNYENIHAFYENKKYIRMRSNSQISLTPGFLSIILKHPKEYVLECYQLQTDVVLKNETNNVMYFVLEDSLLSNEDNEIKLHIKKGIYNEEEWK